MSNVVPGVSLTPEQENTVFHRCWDEFNNIKDISYSTPEDDATVTVYDVSVYDVSGSGPPGLWCPMQCAGRPLESWQDYSEDKREAIRRGFMHGLCNMIGMTPPATLADWQYFRPEICKPVIYDRYFNPLNEQAHRTGDFATGRREIEKWLAIIYAAGVQIPFHPNFQNELTAHLGRVPLTEVDAFLAGFSQRNGLATPEGYTYLLNVAIPLAEAPEAGRRTVMERVVSWLRLALDTPTAPATTEPPYPDSPHLDTPAPTVADLCRLPFTPADLNRLLTSLDVLTETHTPVGPTYRLSGSTVGKGGVRISKTFAALTELHENGLLNWDGWEAVMKAPPYGLTFGEKVLAYEYKSKNTRRRSNTFDAAIEQTRRWLNRWRTAHNSQKQP